MICNDNLIALDLSNVPVPSRKMSNHYLVSNEPEESLSLLLGWEHEQQGARSYIETSPPEELEGSDANFTGTTGVDAG